MKVQIYVDIVRQIEPTKLYPKVSLTSAKERDFKGSELIEELKSMRNNISDENGLKLLELIKQPIKSEVKELKDKPEQIKEQSKN